MNSKAPKNGSIQPSQDSNPDLSETASLIAQKKSAIEQALAESITFLGLNVTAQKVEIIPEQGLFQWTLTNPVGQDITGAVGQYDGEEIYIISRAKTEIVCAISIASHPLGNMINAVIAAFSRNMLDDKNRNNPVEVLTRAWLKGSILRKVPKGKAFEVFLNDIHLKQNIEDLYNTPRPKKHSR